MLVDLYGAETPGHKYTANRLFGVFIFFVIFIFRRVSNNN